MSPEFITNQEKLLADVVNNILPSSKNLYFLVGYFYFSGFEEIYKNVGDKQVKILVGLEIESNLRKRLKECEFIQPQSLSRGEIRRAYCKSLVDIFNDTDFFDTKEKQEAFKIFLKKINDGSLEIKKTVQPNHAKLYIFENSEEHNQGGEFPGTIITGSSNLSSSGFRDRFEINVLFHDKPTYSDALSRFKALWNDAVTIVDKNNLKEFLYNVVEKIWIDKVPNPFLLYVRVLEEFFPGLRESGLRLPGEITKGRFIDLKYQEDAIKRAINILKKHNGVIVADVVGLGKSIIASCIAHNLKMRTILIVPPHLIGQWEDYRYEFEFNAKIYSSGKIDQALMENNVEEEKLVIIDEAHKYRNELTTDYANLHKLCQQNKVILLSATPFNNRPQDVFSMVRLFQVPARSTLQTVDNLSFQFRYLISEYKKIREFQKKSPKEEVIIKTKVQEIANKIREILYPLIIRRSRLDLDAIKEYRDDLKQQKMSFPKVNDPEILDYDLGSLSALYEKTLEMISPEEGKGEFQGTRYKPVNYVLPDYREAIAMRLGIEENLLRGTQTEVAMFMRHLLVRRFESSIFAFQSTLDRIIYSSEQVAKWYEKVDKIPIYKKGNLPDIDILIESTGEDLDEELKSIQLDEELKKYEDKGLWFIYKKELGPAFIKDLKRDIEVLKEIREKWFKKGFPSDPKLEWFFKIVKQKLHKEPNRKIVVFTEFADTAQYLYEQLKDKLRVFKYSASDASEKNKNIIRENFDAGFQKQKDEYDLLIATDAISEGFNLHRAGIVFNYDIPYNPTRVIQRVGRINRINKKVFDELFIYNFFPTATGEKETRVRQISTLKIAMVHALFGEDTKVLTSEEELNSYFVKEFKDAFEGQEELSPEAKYEDFIRRLRSSNPEVIQEALSIPKRVRIMRQAEKGHKGVVVFGCKGDEYVFKFGSKPDECVSLGIAEGLNLFEAELSEESKKISDNFSIIYDQMKDKLFSKKTEVSLDQGKRETVIKIEALIQQLPELTDYLTDLLSIIKDYDSMPDKYAKLIRQIRLEKLKEDLQNLIEQVPHDYLRSIIQRVRTIDEEEESLILSEEFNK